MGVGIQQSKESDRFSAGDQLLRHLQCDQAPQRESNELIRSVRLYLLDSGERVLSHFFNTLERLIDAINALRLNSVNHVRCLDVFHDLEEIHGAATQAMCNENWPVLEAGL